MEDRCVCCGAIIPEGEWVCSKCINSPVNAVRDTTAQKKKKNWFWKIIAPENKKGEGS